MSLATEAGILLAYAVGMLGLLVVACMLIVPLKYVFRLLINSVAGGIAILIINALGQFVGIHISLNAVTAVITGIFGIPGILMILFLQYVFA